MENRILDEQTTDALIAQALERRRIVEGINRTVMRDIRRTARRRLICRWGRMVAFSFGLPLVLVLFGLLLCRYVTAAVDGVLLLVCMVIPAAAMLICAFVTVSGFSVGQGVINRHDNGLKDEA